MLVSLLIYHGDAAVGAPEGSEIEVRPGDVRWPAGKVIRLGLETRRGTPRRRY
jgi:hypothetical protein